MNCLLRHPCFFGWIQGSHSSWKTWENGDSFSSLEKSSNFVIFCQISWKNETNPGNLRTFDSYIAWECISKNLPALLHSA